MTKYRCMDGYTVIIGSSAMTVIVERMELDVSVTLFNWAKLRALALCNDTLAVLFCRYSSSNSCTVS